MTTQDGSPTSLRFPTEWNARAAYDERGARGDYHYLYDSRHRCGTIGAQDAEAMCNEIDRLRSEVAAVRVLMNEGGRMEER